MSYNDLPMSNNSLSIRKQLMFHKQKFIDHIRNNQLSEAISLANSITHKFIGKKDDYDVSAITPYNRDVSNYYSLSGYVNASFITINETTYIAAQEPKEKYISRFVELLTKASVTLIVSLTDQCDYLDDLISVNVIEFGGKELFVDEFYRINETSIRRLRFLCWPDFEVISSEEMSFFYNYYRDIKSETVLVHCRAGVGRTGTFIMYDALKQQRATLESFVDLFIDIRSMRPCLVYNEKQLKFLVNDFLKNVSEDNKENCKPMLD